MRGQHDKLYRMSNEIKSGGKILRIGIVNTRAIKAGRDRVSGCLRYAATCPNWVVRIIPSEANPDPNLDGLIGSATRIMKHGRRDTPRVELDSRFLSYDHSGINASVQIDDAAIGRTAAEILLAGGLRNLAFVGIANPVERTYQNERLAAFREAAHKAGAFCDAFLPVNDSDDDIMRLSEWLAQLPLPCGVMAYADDRAKTVLDACRIAHLKVPDQIHLVGVDNEVEICENMRPSLTSILPDFEKGGYLAARLLDEMLKRGRRPRKPIQRSYGVKTVVVRGSTQDLRGGGRLVTLAREFMRLHAHETITVKDVAAHLNVARRTLENHFREILGRGVADVLRKERLDRVARLLRETDRTIADIAYDSGFASHTHLKAAFKKAFGMTMHDWRTMLARGKIEEGEKGRAY